MGQTSSRNRSEERQAQREQPETASPATTGQVHEDAPRARPKRSRTSTVRRSILGLVTPSSSSNSASHPDEPASASNRSARRSWHPTRRRSTLPDVDLNQASVAGVNDEPPSSGAEHGSAARRKWRLSRRVSKAPAELNIPQQDRIDERVVEEPIAGPSTSPLPAATSPVEDTSQVEQPPSLPTLQSQSSAGTTEELQHRNAAIPSGQTPVSLPSEIASVPAAASAVNPITFPEAGSETPPQRAFPPAGTLVVVQGVVHTTETSPPPNATSGALASLVPPTSFHPGANTSTAQRGRSSSNSRTTGERRGRMSSLLPRPTSSRASTPAPPASGTTAVGNDGTSSNMSLASMTDNVPPRTEVPTHERRRQRAPPLSSSSIDVLGTLLSVAAAATAASLVTGSSDPLLSSGLANTSLPESGSGSMNPTLGNPRPSLHTSEVPSANRDRRRSAWETLRERLGGARDGAASGSGMPIPPTVPAPSSPIPAPAPPAALGTSALPTPPAGPTLRPDGTPMDARELMLAEMVRALNQGLGLDRTSWGPEAGNGTASPVSTTAQEGGESAPASTEGPAPTPAAVPIVPPEGSFERFLLNLQIDLRRALMNGWEEEPATPAPVPAPAPPVAVEQPAGASSTTDADTTVAVSLDDTISRDIEASSASRTTDESARTGDNDMPTLLDVSDSESEDGASNNDEPPHTPADVDATPQPEGSALALPPTPTFGPTPLSAPSPTLPPLNAPQHLNGPTPNRPALAADADDRSINWWRLYRFPAMPAPQARHFTAGAAAGVPANGLSSTPFSPSSPRFAVPSTAAAAGSPAQAGSPAAGEAEDATMVVPIIVVGLQSVNMDRAQRESTGGGEHDMGAGEPPLDADSLDDRATPFEGGSGRPGTPRGRTWGSRAASAFRGLRPARRGTDPRAADGAGSRTFLIYVIGGYYPPNHHIVTGSENLDSFEALLELAELLGQVKPPVATKEEIEKSGLQIIKPSDLQQYEKDGRVASNCVDRCLICLDDYDPDDDLRLMTCRHTFHKDCVDKWMQTGKNNCPACRSKGVAVEGDASTAPAAPASPTAAV